MPARATKNPRPVQESRVPIVYYVLMLCLGASGQNQQPIKIINLRSGGVFLVFI